MPRSAKKRKDKAADFSKAKLKLGKGKRLASNAIDTSFKARSIVLPTQSITQEKDTNAPTTKKRLTFDDLIAHLKHYNAATRRDAILGLRELLEAHWEILDHCLTPLISACVKIIGDEDASVRKALLAFFAWIFPRIPNDVITPHTPLLLLFTTSAQTHIFPEIRIDAVRFLNIFLEHIPETVIAGWNEANNGHGVRVLEGYLGILNAGANFGDIDGHLKMTSTTSVMLTSASKLIVLHSLSTFLQCSISTLTGNTPSSTIDIPASMHTWYLASSFPTTQAYRTFEELLQPSHELHPYQYTWKDVDLDDGEDFPYHFSTGGLSIDSQWSLQDLVDASNITQSSDLDNVDNADVAFIARLTRALHPTLIATFLDCAPTVFSPSSNPPETEVQLILAVGQIARSLYGPILQASVSTNKKYDSSSEDLGVILGYMIPYFPFRTVSSRNIKIEQALLDLNLIFCELSSLLVLTTESSRLLYHEKSHAVPAVQSISIQVQKVSEHVFQLLRGEAVSTSELGKPLTTATYNALLPTIWALLNNAMTDHQLDISSAILQATVEHSHRTSSKSALKRWTIGFVARLVLLDTEPQYQGRFRLGRNAREGQKIEEWVTHLPQTLWELGSSNLPATELILRFLLRALQRNSQHVLVSKTVASLRSKFVPYFRINHAVRGQLVGPYNKLPISSHIRRLALDVIAILGYVDDLCVAVDLAVANTGEQEYWARLRR